MTLSCSKKIIGIIKRNNIKNNGDLYCLNYLHFFGTKNKLELYKRYVKVKNFCNVIMPSKDTRVLEFSQYQKSDKAPFIIYADLECIIQKVFI